MDIRNAFANMATCLIPVRTWRHQIRHSLKKRLNCDFSFFYAPGYYERKDYVPFWGYYQMGMSWSEYLLTNNMPEKVAKLRQNLDGESLKIVDLLLSNLCVLPPGLLNNGKFLVQKSVLRRVNTDEEVAYQEEHFRSRKKYNREYILDQDAGFFAFTTHSGLRNKSDGVRRHLAGRDVIEGGAYIGASTLVYCKTYSARRVYSFEISPETRKRYLQTMERNGMREDQWRLIPMGLSDGKRTVKICDNADMGTNVRDAGEVEVPLCDVDSFVREAGEEMNIGFIVSDVEGAGLDALKGMTDTIRKHRPVLSLGIYHNPIEFFEMKPCLETIVKDLNYTIRIEKLNSSIPHVMTPVLFAYPQELG